ncbi:MAG: CoA pyrophosphatase [Marinifilaceae bacterium]|jgi:8-oxo-dGTP pyrophosphatase MutT (NUDIX family)|nr:CoA pyrophosphatase [Marinifilaceae bacterium]
MVDTEESNKLQEIFKDELPGFQAQLKMSPSLREDSINNSDPTKARDSSVLILFYHNAKGELCFPLIKRTSDNSKHSGQVSLPGGKKEKEDNNNESTAIRETYEELGLNPSKISIIGKLSKLYIPISNFMVYPIIGIYNTIPQYKPSKKEVEYIIECKLKDLLNPDNISSFEFSRSDINIIAPYFNIDDNKVWGATAMILSELKTIFENSRYDKLLL